MYTQAATYSMANITNLGRNNHKSRSYHWLEDQRKSGNRSKWIVLGSIIAILGLIGAAVTAGIIVSRSNAKQNTNTRDGSTFTKNPLLHQSFYGLAYTPAGSQLPDCGNKLSDVIQDIQIMSQLTTRIRLYGADCDQAALVLEAIKQTKVNMTVWLGNYDIPTDNGASYRRQRDAIKSVITTYGTDHIGGVTVGNEFMLNYLDNHGSKVPDSSVGNTGAELLIADIKDTRDMLNGLNLNKILPVGTSDAGSYFNTKVLEAIDYGMANVHPWFANVSAANAASWTANFFQQTNVDAANALPNKPQMYIAETGWPTKSSDKGNESNGPGTASETGLQTFIDTFLCQANQNGTGYFFFEFFDEPWKDAQFGGVEAWWGLFTSDRTLKNINIPDCPSP